jgi:hypothetical protein
MVGATIHGSVKCLSNAPNFPAAVFWGMIVAWNHVQLLPSESINHPQPTQCRKHLTPTVSRAR